MRKKMSKRKILKWSKKIRPIVNHNGILKYLRPLTNEEVLSTWYTYLKKNDDYGSKVNFSEISVLADVKMSNGFMQRACVAEIIEQIPKELLSKVVAFYIVYSQSCIEDECFFNEENSVIIVRLFQSKDETVSKARNIQNYPDERSHTPIGMTDNEFERFKVFRKKRTD